MLGIALSGRDPGWTRRQCPVLLSREIYKVVLRVSFIVDVASPLEFRTRSVPTGVLVVLAGGAVQVTFVVAYVRPVIASAGAAGVRCHYAILGLVFPAPAFQTLNGLLLGFFSALGLVPYTLMPSLMIRFATSGEVTVNTAWARVWPARLLMIGLIHRML